MAKAIKSFNVEKETYDALIKLFKKHSVSTSVSFFVEQCLTKLLADLSELEESLKKTEYYPEIMKFIIEKSCAEVVVTTPGLRPIPGDVHPIGLTTEPGSSFIPGVLRASDESEDIDLTYNPNDWEKGEREEDLEALYWIEEYEAHRQNLPRAFTRLLKTGKFELSRDKRVLIEKETGRRFLNWGGTHVIEVASDAKVIGPNDER
jgi:hypothetical protein